MNDGAKLGPTVGPFGETDRLDSWKEIASYLRRGIRTVTRWEREQGLPVHRNKTGTVYAYKSELDAWWSCHSQEVEKEPPVIDSPPAILPPTPWLRRYRLAVGVAGLVAVAAILASFGLRPRPAPESRLFPVTTYPGIEGPPSLSPDGNQVAFARNGDLFVKQVDGEGSVQLTNTPEAESSPVWSPDGRQIAFRRGPFIQTISPLGGGESRVAETPRRGLARMAWIPDNKSLVVSELTSTICSSLFILSVATGDKTRLTWPPEPSVGDGWPSVSPDGRTLAFARYPQDGTPNIYMMSLDGGEPRRITDERAEIFGLAWTPDGKELVFSSDRSGTSRLWRIPANSHSMPSPMPVEGGGDDARFPSISRPGTKTPVRLAYQRYELDADILRAEVVGEGTSQHALKPATPFLASTKIDAQPQVSPDGKRVAFKSLRSGTAEVWLADSNDSHAVRLTTMGNVSRPQWSRDGRYIGFQATTGALGKYQAYMVDVAGGSPVRLSRNEDYLDALPTWSWDGQWIYFTSSRSGALQLWKMPAAGGDAIQLTKRGGSDARESPDERFVYYTKVQEIGPGLWRIPRGGGEEVRVLETPQAGWWDIARTGIYFIDFSVANGAPKPVKFSSFETRKVNQIGIVEGRVAGLGGLAVSPDGRWLLYSIVKSEEADLMLVDNFR